jgi:hypothetical protein
MLRITGSYKQGKRERETKGLRDGGMERKGEREKGK